ncbi:hypothetical protein NA57DRAFT_75324 [Rhizodiscina lignyota]|uniref:SMP domain-containing protein n=1 Tax=Rhizodiscina lignyota TaxID=1504668 RepID=A0A9P4M7B6_9PEZI|nr:hypothetical protein NA57DRAFT_75324 [Rhizodiscina lignyota]
MADKKTTRWDQKTPTTKDDSSRIQSAQAQGDKDMSSSGFAARAQSADDENQNDAASSGAGTGGTQGQQGQQSGQK